MDAINASRAHLVLWKAICRWASPAGSQGVDMWASCNRPILSWHGIDAEAHISDPLTDQQDHSAWNKIRWGLRVCPRMSANRNIILTRGMKQNPKKNSKLII